METDALKMSPLYPKSRMLTHDVANLMQGVRTPLDRPTALIERRIRLAHFLSQPIRMRLQRPADTYTRKRQPGHQNIQNCTLSVASACLSTRREK